MYRIYSIRRRGYYYFAACFCTATTIFEGGIYFFGKLADINNGWIGYVQAIQ